MAGRIPLFDFGSPTGMDSKMYVSFGALPTQIGSAKTPTKKLPWKMINDVAFVKRVDVVLPEELYNLIWDKVQAQMRKVSYANVMMKLEEVLHGDFFTEYVKIGDVLMLSEGQPGVDNVFSLKNGILSLEMDKESYERAGLQGKPIRGGGRKHVKARYLVEINLRLPAMLHGKKGFERLVWAAKNVLNRSLSWMFMDLQQMKGPQGDSEAPAISTLPLEKHHPTMLDLTPTLAALDRCIVPNFTPELQVNGNEISSAVMSEWCYETTEWLGLAAIQSPRLVEGDNVDPYISRYSLSNASSAPATKLKILRWKGLIPARWITELLVASIFHSRSINANSHQQWLSISATAHRTQALGQIDGYTILLTPPSSSQRDRNEGAAAAAAAAAVPVQDSGSTSERRLEKAPTEQSADGPDRDGGGGGGDGAGFGRFACFHFVDS